MGLRFRPVDTSFFDLLTQSAQHLVTGAGLLAEMLSETADREDVARRMREAEHTADETTHELIRKVNSTFVTPFDREDIYALAGAIDDVVDDIEEASEQLATKHVEAPMEQAQHLAGVLRDCGRELAAALDDLEPLEGIDEHLAEIRRLEQEGDQIYRGALASLFDNAIDPMFVLRWKDIYAALEEAIDRCRSAANSIESIVVKHT